MNNKELFIIKPSSRKDKRYVVVMGQMSHHFGSKNGKNFLDHQDESKRKAYIARHRGQEDWSIKGQHSSGFWSYHIGWTEPTLLKAVQRLEKKFGFRIAVKDIDKL